MASIPLAVQLLTLLPSLVDLTLRLTEAIQGDPATPAEAKARLLALSEMLRDTAVLVQDVDLPEGE